jgi:hypothetical protein
MCRSTVAPDWRKQQVTPDWDERYERYERYGERIED